MDNETLQKYKDEYIQSAKKLFETRTHDRYKDNPDAIYSNTIEEDELYHLEYLYERRLMW